VVDVRGATPRRGIASARIHRSGLDAQRVLLVGDHSFVDGEAGSEGARLAGRLADRVSALTGRGLDLDVVWDLAPALQAVGAATGAWRLWRYEAVVVLVRDAQLHDGRWRSSRITRLAQRVIPELAEASRVLVVRLHKTDDEGQRDGEYAQGVVSSFTVPLDADGLVQGLAQQTDEIAGRAARMLRTSEAHAAGGGGTTARERRALPEPEVERQRAVDRTTEALGGITPHLERVVLMARNTFDVPYAQVNLLDRGRIRTLAYVGMPGEGTEHPICTIAVRGSGPTIIADTWDDHRLDGNPHVHGGDVSVRFYAAHPIESPDGYRVGTLCVFDMKPHDIEDVDAGVLRDLALLAEAEISTLPRN
jgi:hypothetical protein